MATLLPRLLAALVVLASGTAVAAYPDRPIQIIVPYSAGGGADTVARVLAQRMSSAVGQSVLVENRTGAGGSIGVNAVAKAAADGYTVLFAASHIAVDPAMTRLPYDVEKDLLPISLVSIATNILVVPPGAPYRTFAEFVAHGRANPGKLSFGSGGLGTAGHLAGAMLIEMAGMPMVHVAYRGGAPALVDVMGGHISAYFASPASSLGYITSGKLVPLAVTSRERLASLPNIPTITESGFPDYEMLEWLGILLPRSSPPDVVQRLAKEVQAGLADPKVRERILQLGVNPVGGSPQEFARFLRNETARMGQLLKTIDRHGSRTADSAPK